MHVILLFNGALGSGEAGDRNAERRAADVVDADPVEELDGIRVEGLSGALSNIHTRTRPTRRTARADSTI